MTKLLNQFEPFCVSSQNKNASLAQFKLSTLLDVVTEHKLLILKGFNEMTREELLSYCQAHASLLSWDFGPVMEMKVDKQTKNYLFTEGDVPLHWDGAFHQEPRFLFFQCIEAPIASMGGETLFVNTENVWKGASKKKQQEWRQHQLQFSTQKLAHYGGTIQRDLVNKHPQTGNTILRFAEPVGEDYLNPVEVKVMGKNRTESESILKEVSQSMRRQTDLYFHQWEQGDYLIADNFSLLHGRNAFKQESPRHLRRVQIL